MYSVCNQYAVGGIDCHVDTYDRIFQEGIFYVYVKIYGLRFSLYRKEQKEKQQACCFGEL